MNPNAVGAIPGTNGKNSDEDTPSIKQEPMEYENSTSVARPAEDQPETEFNGVVKPVPIRPEVGVQKINCIKNYSGLVFDKPIETAVLHHG